MVSLGESPQTLNGEFQASSQQMIKTSFEKNSFH
jgi:hypothetical protein